jgi:hypothetical protein
MPVNGRSGYKDKMEPKKNTQTTQNSKKSGTKTTICHAYSGREQGQQHLKTMLK